MDLRLVLEQRAKVEEFQRKHRVGLLTLLFTDLVGSTQLKQELGDHAAVALIQQHRTLVRELLRGFKEGEEIETAGDSFFIVFTKPSDAVQFSLLLQSRLRAQGGERLRPLRDRIGIHIGEVVVEERPDSPKPKDLYGLQIDICARVMSLADGDQILMTRSAFDNARQVLKGLEIAGVKELSWLNHGPYLLKGVEEPMEICEVGEVGAAVLKPPADSEKVHRYVSPDAEPVLGWRPALDQKVPGTQWMLVEKLGEGGFGEVWLGRHLTTKEKRVFKFCFRADRVRALKREATLFRLLKERVGEHPNVVRLLEVFFEEPPFYLEMEFVSGRDLRTWSEQRGGVGAIPMETRLEIVAQVAEALQAAHDAGVIHRDIKPSNILIAECGMRSAESGNHTSELINHKLTVKLTDFGIGQVVSEEALAGLTRLGFTQTMMTPGSSAQTGTQMYMAPELIAGKPASTRSDIYSLGVVLYQLLVGDFTRPVTTDWGRRIPDPLLREDLEACFAGEPQDRFGSAAELARQLRALPKRSAELKRQQREKAALERAAYLRGMMRTASVASLIIALMASLAIFSFSVSRKEKRERTAAQRNLYVANMNLAQQAWEQNNSGSVRQLLEGTASHPDRGFEWYYWRRQTHLDLRTLRHTGPLDAVSFSPDGRLIVTGHDGMAKQWEAASGKELLTFKGHRAITSVAFSPDGHRIVTGSRDRTAKVWEVASGKELITLKGHNAWVFSAAFSTDGHRIVTGSGDHTAKVWEAANGRELLTLKGHIAQISSVAFSPNGKQTVTGSADKTARVWEVAGGKEILTLQRHSGGIWSVAFSPDGHRIVTGSADQTAKVWNVASGEELFTLEGHRATVLSAAFSPDGQRIVTGSIDQTAKVWEVASGKELLTLKGHSAPIIFVAFSPDGQRIVSGSRDQTTKQWEVASAKEILTLQGHSAGISSVAFSPNGHRIVTGSVDQTAKVWNVASGEELFTLEGHRATVRSAAFSPDGQRIVTGSMDQTAKVWEVASGKELLTLKGHVPDGSTFHVVFLDGQRIVTGPERVPINSAAFSPDGQRIVTGSGDRTAKVWETASGKELLTLKGHSRSIEFVAFSPDGQRIVTGSEDETARLWEAASGKELRTFKLKAYKSEMASLAFAFSRDGLRIAASTGDQAAKVWETATGKELLTLRGHSDKIRSVAFSPDGYRIVTGSVDKTAKVWETATGRELLTLKGHSGQVSSLAFSPDNRRIVTGGSDGTVKVWEAASPEQAAAWEKEEQAAAEPLAAQR